MKKYHLFTIVFIASSLFANKLIIAQMPVTSIITNSVNYQNSQKNGSESAHESRHDRKMNLFDLDPFYYDEVYFTAENKRDAEKVVANSLKIVYSALKNETTNKKASRANVKGIKVFTIKHGKFHIEKNKNKPIEFVGVFWQYNCKIGEDYIFVTEENAKYDLSSGRFHYFNIGTGQFADFRLILRMESMLIQMQKDMEQLK